jgi:HK97 family phage major capsid protein
MEAVLNKLDEMGKTIEARNAKNQEAFTSLSTRADELSKTLTELQGKVGDLVSRSGMAVSLPGVDEQKEKFQFHRAFKGILTHDWTGCEFEREVLQQTEKRAVQQGSVDNLGGHLIPIQTSAEMIDELKNELIMSALGARMLLGLAPGTYEFTKKTSSATAASKSEIGRSQRTNVTFGNLKLSPKMISAYVPMSERLVRSSSPSIEAIVREDLRFALAEKMETLLFFGSGSNNEPTGITKMAGILGGNNTGVDSGDRHYFEDDAAAGHRLTHEDIITLEGELADRNALRRGANIKLATNHGVLRLLRTEKYWSYDASGASAAELANLPFRSTMPMTDGEVMSRIGHPIVHSNIFPTSGENQGVYTGTYDSPSSGTKRLTHGVFGDWAELLVAIFSGMSIRASRDASDIVDNKFQSAFVQNQVWLRADMEFDFNTRHDEAFVVLNNLMTRVA